MDFGKSPFLDIIKLAVVGLERITIFLFVTLLLADSGAVGVLGSLSNSIYFIIFILYVELK